jgi:hypothetical protein
VTGTLNLLGSCSRNCAASNRTKRGIRELVSGDSSNAFSALGRRRGARPVPIARAIHAGSAPSRVTGRRPPARGRRRDAPGSRFVDEGSYGTAARRDAEVHEDAGQPVSKEPMTASRLYDARTRANIADRVSRCRSRGSLPESCCLGARVRGYLMYQA